MHIHQSVVDLETGAQHLLRRGRRPDAAVLRLHRRLAEIPAGRDVRAGALTSIPIAGWCSSSSAPVNTQWGYDNRTVGLRVPNSTAAGRRLENRLPSSDANPYLAIAASLACGYLGLIERLEAGEPVTGSANSDEIDLPRSILEAVSLFEECEELVEIFGKRFVSTYRAIKQARIRDLHAGDQPVGARISAAECLGSADGGRPDGIAGA